MATPIMEGHFSIAATQPSSLSKLFPDQLVSAQASSDYFTMYSHLHNMNLQNFIHQLLLYKKKKTYI